MAPRVHLHRLRECLGGNLWPASGPVRHENTQTHRFAFPIHHTTLRGMTTHKPRSAHLLHSVSSSSFGLMFCCLPSSLDNPCLFHCSTPMQPAVKLLVCRTQGGDGEAVLSWTQSTWPLSLHVPSLYSNSLPPFLNCAHMSANPLSDPLTTDYAARPP